MTISTPSLQANRAEHIRPLSRYETLTVAELAQLCHEESDRYRRRQPCDERPGRELFRRAVVDRSDTAWAAVYAQYAGVIRRWLALREGDDELVATVFERFWHAVDAEKFGRFTSLAAILNYLKMCAYSVRADRIRAARAESDVAALDEDAQALPARDNVEDAVCAAAEGAQAWAIVREALPDERERQIAYLSYVAGLTPREIYARRRGQFADIAEVYRLKRAALNRLRRSPRLRLLAVS